MSASSLEEEIRHVIKAHLEAGAEREPETIDNFMAIISDNYTGIGTGPEEFFRSKLQFRENTLREREVMIYEVDLEMPVLYVRTIHPDLVLAEGEILIVVNMEENTQRFGVRYSMLLEHQDDKWLINHSHFSLPDYRVDVGGTIMDALKVRNAELEKQVEERTAALNQSLENLKAAQAQLIHQEKMASLGALTAGIAHEIKNPLNFITNFAKLSVDLAQDLENDLAAGEDVSDLLTDLKHNAAAINNHGERADAIVKNMMRHASGKKGDLVDTDINTLLGEYITLALNGKKARTPGFQCRIDRHFDESVPVIKAIPSELGRVFLNVLSNAFDALQDTTAPMIRVETKHLGRAVRIQFSDNGMGIAPAIQDKIFDPFFTTKPAGAGTGLGLSLSYDIITQGHGGTMSVGTSELGGATFVLEMPA